MIHRLWTTLEYAHRGPFVQVAGQRQSRRNLTTVQYRRHGVELKMPVHEVWLKTRLAGEKANQVLQKALKQPVPLGADLL